MSQPPSYEETTSNGKYQRLYQEEDGETYSDDNLGFWVVIVCRRY